MVRAYRLVVTAFVVAAVSLFGCALWGVGPFAGAHLLDPLDARVPVGATAATAGAADGAVPQTGSPTSTAVPTVEPLALPLGPRTTATIPANSTQVLVVSGAGPTSSAVTATLYERASGDWVAVKGWKGHIGKKGWTTRHVDGDLKTPIGTFTLSDAGGRLADPGSDLPYHRSTAFVPPASEPGFGDAMADVFNYVIAIDYNRVPGTSPLDWTRPLGVHRGGGIWLHVDHDGPTHGCVSLPQGAMKDLLKRLRVDQQPVVVMGDAGRLAA